jgi:hypothetical protein
MFGLTFSVLQGSPSEEAPLQQNFKGSPFTLDEKKPAGGRR